MSDIRPVTPLDQNNLTLAYVIDGRISQRFINDYGTVKSVSPDGTHVDVIHSVIGELITGEKLAPYVTANVELLFPASSALSIKYPVAVGDPVFLVGLKDYVESTLNATPNDPPAFRHYSQNTLKAIPLSAIPTIAKVTFEVDSSGNLVVKNTTASGGIQFETQAGKYQIKNAALSLSTLIDSLITTVAGLTTVGSPATHVLNPATIASLNALKAQFDLLLEA